MVRSLLRTFVKIEMSFKNKLLSGFIENRTKTIDCRQFEKI